MRSRYSALILDGAARPHRNLRIITWRTGVLATGGDNATVACHCHTATPSAMGCRDEEAEDA
jgi:hypothetical protein